MNNRFAIAGDEPVSFAPPAPPEICCERDWSGAPPIRLQPSAHYSSAQTDRIINYWRPRIANLVESAIGMVGDFRQYQEGGKLGIDWQTNGNPYPCLPFLRVVGPPESGRDMRHFTDESCHVLLQTSTKEEAQEAYWFKGRIPDARDIMEWIERWSVWLPNESSQFEFWSVFLPSGTFERFCHYVHSLVHDYYLEILERHTLWEERMECEGWPPPAEDSLPTAKNLPTSIRYWHPRLLLDEEEFRLTVENAAEVFAFTMDMLQRYRHSLDQEAKDALEMAAYEAYLLGNPR
jgi:hypothetical protein